MVRLSSIQRFRFLLLFMLADFFVDAIAHQAAAANAAQAPGHQLSPRTISTKYGQIRGAVLYFQNPQTPANSPHLSSPASGDKATGQSNGQQQKPTANTNYLQPVEFFLGVPYATGECLFWLLCKALQNTRVLVTNNPDSHTDCRSD